MKKILLASHGKMAAGLKNTLEIFLGSTDSITAVSAYLDSSDNYIYEIESFIDSVHDDAIIFTDINGGSVNQKVMQLVLASNKDIPVITSMNLPIVLSIALLEEEITKDKINELIKDCTPLLTDLHVVKHEGDDLSEFFES